MREWLHRLLGSFRPGDARQREEMELHVELEVEAGIRRGLSRGEAVRQARLKLGSPTTAAEALRDQQRLPSLEAILGGLRHAGRALRRQPGFTVLAAGALAAAVTVVTLVFALVEGVLLRPLPYRDPGRLVRVYDTADRTPRWPISIGRFQDYQRLAASIESIGLYTRLDVQLMHGDRPERLAAMRVTPGFFTALGVQPALGRNFRDEELRGFQRVVILSHPLWMRRFQGDRAIVGRKIRIDREEWIVAGVMPAGFQHIGGDFRSTLQGETVDAWWPLRLDIPAFGLRAFHYTNAVARLKAGVRPEEARAEMERILGQTENSPRAMGVRVEQLAGEVVGASRQTLLLLAIAGAIVWLAACANVAGLCLARALARSREIAVQQALGASAGRIAGTVVAESAWLGLAGLGLGLLLTMAALPLLRELLPAAFPRLHEIRINGLALGFAAASALGASLLAGLVPAWRQARSDPAQAMGVSTRSATTSSPGSRSRALLVTVEIALAALLCVTVGLLARSAWTLAQRDHGFDSARVLTFQLSLPDGFWKDPVKTASFYREAALRFASIPGVASAGFSTNLPWRLHDENTGFEITGRQLDPEPMARYQAATPGFFTALGFRLRAGRWIDERDTPGSPRVMIVNRTLAERFLPGESAVGHEVTTFGKRWRIVGVVEDVRDQPAQTGAPPAFWFPMAQEPFHLTAAAVRVRAGDPLDVLPAVGRALREVDPELALSEARAMDDVAADALAESRFALWTFEVLGGLVLVLTALGIYGLLAYQAAQRRREFGVRLALGASRVAIARLVLRGGLRLAAAGLAIAALLVPFAIPFLRHALYGISPFDAAALAFAFVAVAAIAAAASVVPAWSASRTETIAALREE